MEIVQLICRSDAPWQVLRLRVEGTLSQLGELIAVALASSANERFGERSSDVSRPLLGL